MYVLNYLKKTLTRFWKMFLTLPKVSVLLPWRYSNICASFFLSFNPCSQLLNLQGLIDENS